MLSVDMDADHSLLFSCQGLDAWPLLPSVFFNRTVQCVYMIHCWPASMLRTIAFSISMTSDLTAPPTRTNVSRYLHRGVEAMS